jgi:fluoroquinolone transport system permease protein
VRSSRLTIFTGARWELVLQTRHQFYAVTGVVTVVWVALLLLVPVAVRQQPANVVPMFVLANLQITAFYFAAALLLLERTQGVVAALVTSPLRPSEYVAIKVVTLTLLGTAEQIAIVALVFGPDARWWWLLLGTALASTVYVCVGLAVAARHTAINTFLIPSIGWITALSLPLLGFYNLLPRWTLAWHPLSRARLVGSSASTDLADARPVRHSGRCRLVRSRLSLGTIPVRPSHHAGSRVTT